MQKALEKMHRGLSLYDSHEGAGARANQTGRTARPRPDVEPSTRKNDQLGREELIKQYFFAAESTVSPTTRVGWNSSSLKDLIKQEGKTFGGGMKYLNIF